eukprot:g13983.t1
MFKRLVCSGGSQVSEPQAKASKPIGPQVPPALGASVGGCVLKNVAEGSTSSGCRPSHLGSSFVRTVCKQAAPAPVRGPPGAYASSHRPAAVVPAGARPADQRLPAQEVLAALSVASPLSDVVRIMEYYEADPTLGLGGGPTGTPLQEIAKLRAGAPSRLRALCMGKKGILDNAGRSIKSYVSGVRVWLRWCKQVGRGVSVRDITEEAVLEYSAVFRDGRTFGQYVQHLKFACKLAGAAVAWCTPAVVTAKSGLKKTRSSGKQEKDFRPELFELRLEELLSAYNFDPAVREQMENGQRNIFEKAKELWCEGKLSVFKQAAVKKAECQRLLFFPNPTDMRFYVEALRKGTQSDSGHLSRLKLMTLFYSLHHGTKELLEAFVVYGGLVPIVKLITYKKNAHVQSQACEIFQTALTLPGVAKLSHEIQSALVQVHTEKQVGEEELGIKSDGAGRAEGSGSVDAVEMNKLSRAGQLLTESKYWARIYEAVFSETTAAFFDAMQELLLDTKDVFPHSRVTACKLLGFVLQVFCQPLLQDSASSGGTKNVRIPSKLYAKIVALHESGELPPDDMNVVHELLNFLNDYDFDAEKNAAALEDAEDLVPVSSSPSSSASSVPATPSKAKQLPALLPSVFADLAFHLQFYKKMGNSHFKKQNFPSSVDCYEHALRGFKMMSWYVAEMSTPEQQPPSGPVVEDAGMVEEHARGVEKKIGEDRKRHLDTLSRYYLLQENKTDETCSTNKNLSLSPDLAWCFTDERKESFGEKFANRAKDKELNLELSRVSNNLAFSLQKVGRLDDASLSVNQACSFDPTFAKAFYRKAEIALLQKNVKTAEQAIYEAVKLEPKDKAIVELKKKILAV